MTGQAILTPMLMVLMMVVGDFMAMSSSTDNVRPRLSSVWRVGNLTIAGVILGALDLLFCVSSLAIGKYLLNLDLLTLRTLTVVTLVFSGQAVFYVARERRHIWSSPPGRWLVASSIADLGIISVLAITGVVMTALPITIMAGLFVATIIFAFVLDTAKVALFRRLKIA